MSSSKLSRDDTNGQETIPLSLHRGSLYEHYQSPTLLT